MPKFCIAALERFTLRTVYEVEAADAEEAERMCREGEVGYDRHTIEEDRDEWLGVLSVEEA